MGLVDETVEAKRDGRAWISTTTALFIGDQRLTKGLGPWNTSAA